MRLQWLQPFGEPLYDWGMASIFRVELERSEATLEYDCSSEESLLQAGLRAGLPLRYKCTNGSCGECRSRLIEGEITATRGHDFPLSSKDREDGWFLSCTHAPASVVSFSAPLFDDAIEIPHQTIKTKIRRLEFPREELAILTLRTPRSNTLQFLAGQEVMLSHLLTEHRYPIASCPCNGMELEFHIQHHPSDPFSQLLFSSLRRGESVTIDGPRGQFVLNEVSDRPLVLIAWESGFAAIRSLVDHFVSLEMENSVSLYWVSTHPPYQAQHARAWSAVIDQFDYHWVKPLAADLEQQSEQLIEQVVQQNDLRRCDLYLSAPAEILITLGGLLLDGGLPEQQFRATPL